MVIGNPDSWDSTISFSDKDSYESCTWSPCGRFIAAQTKSVVEIRNQLTFQLLAVLKSPKNAPLLKGPLAYSPDGRSLACGFSGGIVIWDIQTGGVARSIDCHSDMRTLVWSGDGRKIAAALLSSGSISGVETYDVISGAQIFESKINSRNEWISYHWAHENSFRAITKPTSRSGLDLEMSIFEIGPTLPKIERLHVAFSPPSWIAFSPSTYRISLLGPGTLCIIDARNSQRLFEDRGNFFSLRFSSDANLLAAPQENGFRVWKYISGSYALFGEFLLPHIPFFSPHEFYLEFSPTSASVLSRCGNILQVWRLHEPPISPRIHHQHAAISHSGRYIATADKSQNTIIIIDVHSRAPSQFIDTGEEIEGLAITGNVLLVAFSEKVVGWLLTEEGRVAGVVGNERVSQSDSIWTVTSPLRHPKSLCFRVSGQVGLIGTHDTLPFRYHTGTGGVPDYSHQPRHFDFPWISLYKPGDYKEYHYLRHDDAPQRDTLPEDGWSVLGTTTGKAGWVMDPDGRHRFWAPVEWRRLDNRNWHHDITTLFVGTGDQPVVIKF